MITKVVIGNRAQKALRKLPSHVVTKLAFWVSQVELVGLEEVRKIPGFHDEPYKDVRSIRLSRSYRALYVVEEDSASLEYVLVQDANNHYGD